MTGHHLRRGLVLPIALLAAASTGAAEPLELPLIVETGQRMRLEYQHTRLVNRTPRASKVSATLAVIDADSNPDALIAEWLTESVLLDGTRIDAQSPEAAELMIGVPITFVAGTDLSPARIYDRKALLERMMVAEFYDDVGDEARQGMRSFLENTDDMALAGVLLKVPGYLSICQNSALTPGEPVETATDFATAIPDLVIDATIRYEIIEQDEDTAVLKYSTIHDPDDTKAAFKAFVASANPDVMPSDEELDDAVFERSDTADCDIDRGSGWVRKMTYDSKYVTPFGSQIERYVIRVERIE